MFDSIRTRPRWQRLALWFGVMYVIGFGFSMTLSALFNPPLWVLFVSCGALGFVTPAPRWARWQP